MKRSKLYLKQGKMLKVYQHFPYDCYTIILQYICDNIVQIICIHEILQQFPINRDGSVLNRMHTLLN